MNWQDVTFPLVECRQREEDGSLSVLPNDSRDATSKYLSAAVVRDIANALYAEVELLRETKRKLAVIVNRLIEIDKQGAGFRHVHGQELEYGDLPELLRDSDVAAAIKEAGNEQA